MATQATSTFTCPSTSFSTISFKREKAEISSAARSRRQRSKYFEFIGVDGEGVTDESGIHRYVLLGVGEHQIENPLGLNWQECFTFLYSEFERRPNAAFVGFFLGYDFSQILKTLPEDRARILLTKEGINARRRIRSGKNRKPFPVRFHGWEFDMLPGRRLQLRPLICDCDQRHKKCVHTRPPWMYICDCGSFWQTSFVNVLNPQNWKTPICTEAEYDKVLEGKARRSEARLDDDMRFYNRLENVLLARCMGELRKGFLEIGVRLSKAQWFGPGQAAAEWMRKENVPRRDTLESVVPSWFVDAARSSYFGGWFEIFSHGICPGFSWEYDLNSAYPYIISKLPCLLHGRYSRGVGNPPKARKTAITLVRCRAESSNRYIGSMLNRSKKGTIRRPLVTEGWYWLHEIESAERAGIVHRFSIREWVQYRPCACNPPLRGVASLYDKRLEVGKSSVLGKSAKLVYNSMYGKFAQSVGAAPYSNWIYASLITSGCRSLITDAISSHPGGTKSVVMVATDGVFFDSVHPTLALSEKLGEWSEKKRENLTLFKPGVYWDDNSRHKIASGSFSGFRARGVSARDFARNIGTIDERFLAVSEKYGGHIPEFRVRLFTGEKYQGFGERKWPDITFGVQFSMTTALQALNNHSWDSAGLVSSSVEVTHSSDPIDKRGKPWWDSGSGRIRSSPITLGAEETLSTSYEKKFGLEDPFSSETFELLGTTMDELVVDALNLQRRLLTGEG